METELDCIKQYHKTYYENHKNKILTQMREPVLCEHCGHEVTKQHLKRHQRSKSCRAILTGETRSSKKINELNDFIKLMNEKYQTNHPLFVNQ